MIDVSAISFAIRARSCLSIRGKWAFSVRPDVLNSLPSTPNIFLKNAVDQTGSPHSAAPA